MLASSRLALSCSPEERMKGVAGGRGRKLCQTASRSRPDQRGSCTRGDVALIQAIPGVRFVCATRHLVTEVRNLDWSRAVERRAQSADAHEGHCHRPIDIKVRRLAGLHSTAEGLANQQ